MTEKLTFYTTGKYFTNLLWMFIEEGNYAKAILILRQSLGKEDIKKFFKGEKKFIGDTRKDGLYFIDNKKPLTKKEFYDTIYYGLRTLDSKINKGSDRLITILNSDDENIKSLLTIFSRDEIKDIIFTKDFKYTFLNKINSDNFNGVITQEGDIIECEPLGHHALYIELYNYGISSYPDWIDDNKCVHISSGQATLSKYSYGFGKLTNAQLKVLFESRNIIVEYGLGGNILKFLLYYIKDFYNKGGKYNNLQFIKTFYPNINLPKFSTKKIKGVKNCIRTSPNNSIPGILESVFDIEKDSIDKLKKDFIEYQKISEDKTNKLHYFYQEYIEGYNGVAHYDGILRYSCSKKRGDIVNGKVGTKTISRNNEDILSSLGEDLYNHFNKLVQFEFVVDKNGVLYLLQFRLLHNTKNTVINRYDYDRILFKAKSFNKKNTEVYKKDVLIIEDECDSKELLNKKFLIVKNDLEFSHALALSYTLNIPSVYNIDIDYDDLPEKFYVDTTQEVGLILKLE